ncbi:rho gtpase-activating protein 8 [Moniliophthora roreri]|nr:rho gtpase-activating protein 8 [Moniliophthora roreri]
MPWTESGWGKRVEVRLGGTASIRCSCMSSSHRYFIKMLFSLTGAVMRENLEREKTITQDACYLMPLAFR